MRLPGGNAGGAVLVDGTVRRRSGPWTPAVQDLLVYLASRNFEAAPRPLGYDEHGREIVSYLVGDTVGESRPWPEWTRSERALRDAGVWLRGYHDTVRDYQPPVDAIWRASTRPWRAGDVIAHNDAAPYNAVWSHEAGGGLVGFIDWDFAAPQPPLWDLAYMAFSWVPLHARTVVTAEGFTDFDARGRRLRLLLDAYGWNGPPEEVLDAVYERVNAHIDDVRTLAKTDPLFAKLVTEGAIEKLQCALTELGADRASLI